jgi:hypothetical protein
MTQTITRKAVAKVLHVTYGTRRFNRTCVAVSVMPYEPCTGVKRFVSDGPLPTIGLTENAKVWNLLLRFEASSPTAADTQRFYASILDLGKAWTVRADRRTAYGQARATAKLVHGRDRDDVPAVAIAATRYDEARTTVQNQLTELARTVIAAESAHKRTLVAA